MGKYLPWINTSYKPELKFDEPIHYVPEINESNFCAQQTDASTIQTNGSPLHR